MLNDWFTAFFTLPHSRSRRNSRAVAIANTFNTAIGTPTSTATAAAPKPTALSMQIAPTQARMRAVAKVTTLVVTTHTNVVALETEVAKPKH